MNERFFLVLVLFLLSCSLVTAISVDADRAVYSKGQQIVLTGTCNRAVSLLAYFDETKKIFEESSECIDGKFELRHEIGFVEPTGEWALVVSSGGEEARKLVEVNPSSESQFLLVSVLRPAANSKYYRTDELELAVKVSDSGKAVNEGKVVFWDLSGKKHELLEEGEGIYSFKYEIPFNAVPGLQELSVVAADFSGKAGGETVAVIEVIEAPINVKFVRPIASNYEVESEIQIEVELSYFNGKPVGKGFVQAIVSGNRVDLNMLGQNYFAEYVASKEELGSLAVVVEARDEAGNKGENRLNLVITGDPGLLYFKEQLPLFAVLVIAVIIIVLFLFVFGRNVVQLRMLESEQKKLNNSIKILQKQYFDETNISKEAYRARLSKLEARLSEVNKKLNKLMLV